MAPTVFQVISRRDTHPIRIRTVDTQGMEDALQLDLVDYIADAIGDTEAAFRLSRLPMTGGCVHFEHTSLPPSRPEPAPCVQNEHIDAAAPVMSAHRLLVCLAILGWSERELGRRADRHQTTIKRWTSGSGVIARDVAEWLEALVGFHTAHPAPRAADGISSRSGSLIPAL